VQVFVGFDRREKNGISQLTCREVLKEGPGESPHPRPLGLDIISIGGNAKLEVVKIKEVRMTACEELSRLIVAKARPCKKRC